MCLSKVVFSFDDGRKDNIDVVYPILKKYGIKATFNIATGFIDGTIPRKDIPCDMRAMSVDDLVLLYREGHEIASHSNNHTNNLHDIEIGLKKLRGWLNMNDNDILGYASPHSLMTIEEAINTKKWFLKQGISYVRLGLYEDNIVKKIARKVAMNFHSKSMFLYAFNDSVSYEKENIYSSVPITRKTTVEQILYYIMMRRKFKKNCILMFHSVKNPNEQLYNDAWTWDACKFDKLCNQISKMQEKKQINICTNSQLVRSSI